ncbi:hypothetical protein HY491_03405 [Candidatus Woesearchaeota archaeon]|nr:hypothetical protein [Candidatus Woesearchaeota archaeon]
MKLLYALFVLSIILLIPACTKQPTGAAVKQYDFTTGLGEIKKIEWNFNAVYPEMPATIDQKADMRNRLSAFYEQLHSQKDTEDTKALIAYLDFRLSALETERLYQWSQRKGRQATVADGFGCKDMPVILDAAAVMNNSADAAERAASHFTAFMNGYPSQFAQSQLITATPVLLRAQAGLLREQSRKEERTITYFCGNVTQG